MAAGLGLPPPSQGPPFTFNSSTELLTSLKQEFTHASTTISTSNSTSNSTTSPSCWVCATPDGTVWAPGVTDDEGQGGLKEDRSGYDVTAKLFYLVSQSSVDSSTRAEYTEDALGMVRDVLGTDTVDLCIVSFPGVYFDANDEASGAIDDGSGGDTVAQQDETKSILETYAILEKLVRDGRIGRIGLSEFGTARLAKLFAGLEQQQQDKEPISRIRPRVVQINVRDCCVVPKELILYAKRQGIELLTHNDCADVLTKEEIERVVEEGGVWDALWEHEPSLSMPEDGVTLHNPSPKPRPCFELFPQWVIKYTAVVRDRGVVENKGCVFPISFIHIYNANKGSGTLRWLRYTL